MPFVTACKSQDALDLCFKLVLTEQCKLLREGILVYDAHLNKTVRVRVAMPAVLFDYRAGPKLNHQTQSPALKNACVDCVVEGIRIKYNKVQAADQETGRQVITNDDDEDTHQISSACNDEDMENHGTKAVRPACASLSLSDLSHRAADSAKHTRDMTAKYTSYPIVPNLDDLTASDGFNSLCSQLDSIELSDDPTVQMPPLRSHDSIIQAMIEYESATSKSQKEQDAFSKYAPSEIWRNDRCFRPDSMHIIENVGKLIFRRLLYGRQSSSDPLWTDNQAEIERSIGRFDQLHDQNGELVFAAVSDVENVFDWNLATLELASGNEKPLNPFRKSRYKFKAAHYRLLLSPIGIQLLRGCLVNETFANVLFTFIQCFNAFFCGSMHSSNLNRRHERLCKASKQLAMLTPTNFWTIKLHEALHLAKSFMLIGPFKSLNTLFTNERFNLFMHCLLTATRGTVMNILIRYSLVQFVQKFRRRDVSIFFRRSGQKRVYGSASKSAQIDYECQRRANVNIESGNDKNASSETLSS